jgi:hypothetical protein
MKYDNREIEIKLKKGNRSLDGLHIVKGLDAKGASNGT